MMTAPRSIRLGLVMIALVSAVLTLGFAQQMIADAAELPGASTGVSPAGEFGFHIPMLLGEDVDVPDMEELAVAGAQILDFDTPGGVAVTSGRSAALAPAEPLTGTLPSDLAQPAVYAYPDPGWPRTTAVITLAASVMNPPVAGKWIDIDLTHQTVTAYVGSTPVKTVLTSTGTRAHPTVVGTFHVWARVPSQTMRGGSVRNHDRYALPGVPNILYFYRGYSLHGAYWHRNFGHPMSHGCANLTLDDSAWLYNWTPLGTTVRVHNS